MGDDAEVVHGHVGLVGADDGSRTRDLELGKLALYQLSYVRVAVILGPAI